jgi:dTDP-4-amino-4,6-dideoxygalactose transaminase
VKTKLEDLALLGGPAAFAETLHVGRPNIGNRQRLLTRINDMLDRRWLTNHGVYVAELEQRLAEYLAVKHCIAMCNGTVALEIAARALGLSGEVIVPAFTFVATAHALQWQEITPVFCDVDPQTHNLDPHRIEALITPRTTGIVGVHVWGQACDVDALTAIARRHDLRLMFDAAHAFGCSYGGRMIGNFGDAEVFSFHATKFFNTFEGGAVTTNDDALAAKIRLMHNFGFAGLDNVIYIGTNGKMSEVSAAMGLTGLESLEEFIAVNRRNYQHYHQQAGGCARRAPAALRRAGAQQLPIHRGRGRCPDDRHQPGRTGAAAPRRKGARPALFLPRLPPHGAVPLLFSPRRPAAAGHRGSGATGHDPAHRHRRPPGGYQPNLPTHRVRRPPRT